MFKRIRAHKRKIAAKFLLVLLLNIFYPTSGYSLTSGPSQPEFSGFTPVESSEMVDVATGDFNYNLPLMTVPGPNGGYPINLSYNAGIGTEQEASWVGLGWNLNVGEISRTVRGLPDDFKGDEITKQTHQKDNVTLGFNFKKTLPPKAVEVLGKDFTVGKTWGLYYNNYRGIGITAGLGLESEVDDQQKANMITSLDFSFDSQSGIGLKPGISYTKITSNNMRNFFTLDAEYSSREGLRNIGFDYSRQKVKVTDNYDLDGTYASSTYEDVGKKSAKGAGVGVSFEDSYVPSVPFKMTGTALYMSLEGGKAAAAAFNGKAIGVNFSQQHVDDNEIKTKGYGYLYFSDASSNEDMLDFNREKEYPATQDALALPVPINTYDVLSVKGQGLGGVFRPFRNDIGYYHTPKMHNVNASISAAVEVGITNIAHAGVDVGEGASSSYSGIWKDSYNDLESAYRFSNGNSFYFKMNGELNAGNSEESRYSGRTEKSFRIKKKYKVDSGLDIASFEPEVFNKQSYSTSALLTSKDRAIKDKRANNIEYYTRQEVTQLPGYSNRPAHMVPENQYPGRSGVTMTKYDYSTRKPDHIGMYKIRNSEGMVYEYGLPVYNSKEKDAIFTTTPGTSFASKVVSYATADASISNSNGEDHFFSKSETPEYAYVYLLTAVYSNDYVDLTGDGPTEDDFGYWVKFNYSQVHTAFNWRSPYNHALASYGYYSNEKDDKATYSYGEKEIWYLNSVETKTHVAEFSLSDRSDGKGANGEHPGGGVGSQKLRRLDAIALYNKNDRNIPIKTVHFGYDYSLCPGAPNRDVSAPGKLTLKELWFTYLNNDKGKLNKYKFQYASHSNNYNYGPMKADRWGNYMGDRTNNGGWLLNNDQPYVDQKDRATDDLWASAWSLDKITLPSGGEIVIDYESDDYAYVQDKRAMQMCRIVETGAFESGAYVKKGGKLTKGKKEYERVYFELNQPIPLANAADVKKYLVDVGTQQNPMYFKAFMKLKKKPGSGGDYFEDYVDGYCQFEQTEAGVDNNCIDPGNTSYYRWGYVDLESAPKRQTDFAKGETHPFTKAAWEYLKMERNDVLSPDPGDAPSAPGAVVTFIVNIANDIKNLFGYYNNADISNWGNEVRIDTWSTTYRPSFIRLNHPDYKKIGGGLRVKKITSTDNWTLSGATASSYSTSYEYTMPDGKSSGVAEYEPQIGNEEIPHHLPADRYKALRTFTYNSRELYPEEPFCESYFPAPNVAYRRVIVRSLNGGTGGAKVNKKTAAGQTVYEFYTAKEFPLQVHCTPVEQAPYNPVPIIIPFFGTQNYSNNGYSEGYSIELNDMHGKLRSVATYPALADVNNPLTQPKTKTEYIYNVAGTFNPAGSNTLNNNVTALTADGVYSTAEMGIKTDFAMDLIENSSWSFYADEQINLDVPAPFVFIPTWWPALSYSESMYRSVSNVKVVQRQGILMSTRAFGEGSVSIQTNLMFDALTGSPLLTSVNNDFDKPIYTYNFPAHWYYNGMAAAYLNYRNTHSATIGSGGVVNISSLPAGYFNIGDKIIANGNYYWVQNIAGGNMTLIDETGTPAASSSSAVMMSVTESARKNHLETMAGTIVSLTNPVGTADSPLLDAFNAILDNGATSNNFTYTKCNGTEIDMLVNYINIGGAGISEVVLGSATGDWVDGCKAFTINFPTPFSSLSDLLNYRFYLSGSVILAQHISNPALNFTCTYTDDMACGDKCMDDVLNAAATHFSDKWTYPYADVQAPDIGANPYATAATNNPWRYGQWGIWRAAETYRYLVDRKQKRDITTSPTNLAKDGVFESFIPFIWKEDVDVGALNQKWTKANTVTKYSPYGFELENRDAIDMISTALYGYKNALPIATAQNAKYYETASDGFEDYAGGTYTPTVPHGHINMTGASSTLSTQAHTGLRSLAFASTVTANFTSQNFASLSAYLAAAPSSFSKFTPLVGTHKYSVCAWFRPEFAGDIPEITVSGAGWLSSGPPIIAKNPIEGWIRVERVFELQPTAGNVDIAFSVKDSHGTIKPGYMDDVRIQPYTSAMETYVYDPVKLWTVAKLDNRNYATFYNYDEEGNLVQVKKETERGVMTIQQGRKNIKLVP